VRGPTSPKGIRFSPSVADEHGREKEFEMSAKIFIRRLWSDERGQSTTEYILILSVVVMIAMKFKSEFGKQLNGVLEKVIGKMQSATGDDF
jgi:Flp pilus assembly pilin Flp